MFNPSSWFAIDRANHRVGRLVVPSLEAGLDLVGRGRVAALVGWLRPGAAVVDVDVSGDFGHWLAHEVAGWVESQGWWVLLRPSGGRDGRHHVFVAYGVEHEQESRARLRAYLDGLIDEVSLRRGKLDLRDAVRPLSSPHRRGAVTRPRGDMASAMAGLRKVFGQAPVAMPVRRRPRVTARTPGQAAVEAAAGNVAPLFLQRWRRELRPDWRHYLLAGKAPAGDWSGGATVSREAVTVDRSLIEAACTRELVWAVGDPQIAWQLIRESHPSAMTKAKDHGWSWWTRYVWNPAVTGAGAFLPTVRQAELATAAQSDPGGLGSRVDAELVDSVMDARERLDAFAWTLGPRARPALLLVGHHLLDRMARSGQLRVPCPERDLVLDTGISDRKTIRTVLRRLDGVLGTLHKDSLDQAAKATTSYEFEIAKASSEGVREIPPPSFHPPPPPAGLWSFLPRGAHSVWRALLASGNPGLPLLDVPRAAGLTETPTAAVTKSHRATVHTALRGLARSGLARVDEHGTWTAQQGPRSTDIQQRAQAEHLRLRTQVEAERTAYRAGETSSWAIGRARAAKLQRAKERAWWGGLSAATRHRRRDEWRTRFDTLSITKQAALKSRLADGRRAASIDENEHHRAWLDSLTPDEYVERSQARKKHFADLSTAERGLAVNAWNRHRERYGLTSHHPSGDTTVTDASARPVGPALEHQLLPDGTAGRDAAFEAQLTRQLALDGAEHTHARPAAGA